MIHFRPPETYAGGNGGADWDFSRRREQSALAAAAMTAVRRAKRAADESLQRVQEAPGPHVATNGPFVALYGVHLRDREMLFAAMRDLDETHEALRCRVAEDPVHNARGRPSGDMPGRLTAGYGRLRRRVPGFEF